MVAAVVWLVAVVFDTLGREWGGLDGLVHVSEFGSEEKLRKVLELGKTYDFKISLFDPKEQKMALSFVGTK